MDTPIDEMIHSLSTIPEESGASACFGAPVERNGHTIIPVARVAFGYGAGFGRGTGTGRGHGENGAAGGDGGSGEGGGGGGGGSSTPVAIIDVSGTDVRIEPIIDQTRISVSGMVLGGWVLFWLFFTVRTVARQTAKTRRMAIERGG
jgi:uncharacterized spore protein YtfJ